MHLPGRIREKPRKLSGKPVFTGHFCNTVTDSLLWGGGGAQRFGGETQGNETT